MDSGSSHTSFEPLLRFGQLTRPESSSGTRRPRGRGRVPGELAAGRRPPDYRGVAGETGVGGWTRGGPAWWAAGSSCPGTHPRYAWRDDFPYRYSPLICRRSPRASARMSSPEDGRSVARDTPRIGSFYRVINYNPRGRLRSRLRSRPGSIPPVQAGRVASATPPANLPHRGGRESVRISSRRGSPGSS